MTCGRFGSQLCRVSGSDTRGTWQCACPLSHPHAPLCAMGAEMAPSKP